MEFEIEDEEEVEDFEEQDEPLKPMVSVNRSKEILEMIGVPLSGTTLYRLSHTTTWFPPRDTPRPPNAWKVGYCDPPRLSAPP